MNHTTNKIKKNILPLLRNWLSQGKTITHNQAQAMWHTNRLSEYIRRLRHDHHMNIEMKMVIENGDQYGVYRLVQKPKVSGITTQRYRA